MPDRLPSLIVLVGFWIPPAVAGWVAANPDGFIRPRTARAAGGMLAAFAVGYAALWFFFNVERMPPYIPGATMDPTVATPRAIRWLALVSGAGILPLSALVCAFTYRLRTRQSQQSMTAHAQ